MTKRFSLVVLSFFFLIAHCSSAYPQAAPASKSTLLERTIPAPSLKGNLLGDPTQQKVYIYLPPSYDATPTKRFPTLYLLHGFLSSSAVWVTGSYQGLNLQTLMDELIRSGKVREMIVVAANGKDSYGGSFYSNSTVTGNWDDFITRDLVGNIDANYRTIPRAESRGIAGHSMGGYGAVMLGMKHPDVFSALFALSPCCLVMEDDMSEANPTWSKVLSLSSREQLKTQPMNAEEFYNSAFVALAAAFSPNPTRAPFYVDFPFETKAGLCSQPASPDALKTAPCVQRVEAPYLKWRASFPTYIAEANKANLMKLRGIFIDYGEKEQFVHIRTGVQAFSKALSVLNVPHQFEVYPEGDHGSRIRLRMETRVIEFFNEKLVFEK